MNSLVLTILVIGSCALIVCMMLFILKNDNLPENVEHEVGKKVRNKVVNKQVDDNVAQSILFPFQLDLNEDEIEECDYKINIKSGKHRATYRLKLNSSNDCCLISGPNLKAANLKEAKIILPDRFVSCGGDDLNRAHAVIIKNDQGYYLKDTQSSNGTKQIDSNGNVLDTVDSIKLCNNLRLRLGDSVLHFIDCNQSQGCIVKDTDLKTLIKKF